MPMNYKKSQSHLLIENINLVVSSICDNLEEKDDLNQENKAEEPSVNEMETYKKKRLRLWEEQTGKDFESMLPPSWIKGILDNIYNNMNITIKKIQISFQNKHLFNMETCLKLKIEEINLNSTDANWKS